jgi:pentatricopeptide repeat protein
MEERAVEEARAAFLAMLMRNSVSWHAMVSRFASAGDMDMADECFGDALEREDTSFWTTMMSGYMDAANVEKAKRFFQAMPVRNFISWDAVVAAYVKNSRPEGTFRVFKTMVGHANVRPIELTDTKQRAPWMQQHICTMIRGTDTSVAHEVVVE